MEDVGFQYFSQDCRLGDKRLTNRLFRTFDSLAKQPTGTLPQKLRGRAELVGGYRMFNNPKVTHQALLQAHQARCLQQLQGYNGKLLLLHDTTLLDYSGLDIEGLGPVGNGNGKGLYAHNTLAVIPSSREVIGLLNQILHKQAKVPKGETKNQRKARPDRESRLWKQAVVNLPVFPPGIVVTDVSDRGSDISEYLWHEISAERQFIVRSQHNRQRVNGRGQVLGQKLHDRLRALKPMGHYPLRVPSKAGGWREVKMALAWEQVTIPPPRQARGDHGTEPVSVWAVIAREVPNDKEAKEEASQEKEPSQEEAIEWILLTNRPVESFEQALEVVEDYGCRWMIEELHKAMKSGCGIEQTQMTSLHGLSNVIATLSVLAVHVLRLRCQARDEATAQQPAHLHEEPLKVQLAARDSKHPHWRQMTVWEFYIAVARMGGYLLNPKKKPPGWIVLWRGYIRLEDMCEGIRLMSERCVQT
jgi:hypothetical protein